MRGAAQPLWVMRVAGPWLAVAGAAILSGAFAAGQADVWLGRNPALLLIAAVAGGTFLSFLVSRLLRHRRVANSGDRRLPRRAPAGPSRVHVRSALGRRVAGLCSAEQTPHRTHTGHTLAVLRPALARRLLWAQGARDQREHLRTGEDVGGRDRASDDSLCRVRALLPARRGACSAPGGRADDRRGCPWCDRNCRTHLGVRACNCDRRCCPLRPGDRPDTHLGPVSGT